MAQDFVLNIKMRIVSKLCHSSSPTRGEVFWHVPINAGATFVKVSDYISLRNTSGFSGDYEKNYLSISIHSQLVRKNDIFTDFNMVSGKNGMKKDEELIKDTLFYIEKGMDVVKIESGKYPVLFTSEGLEFLLKVMISALDGQRIFQKISPLHSKLGETVVDNRITIHDDPTLPGGDNYIPFDDEGVIARKKVLIQEGVLKNFLLDLNYGSKLNMPPGGNGIRTNIISRNYENYPFIWPTTVTVDPGNVSSSDILENTDCGILVRFAPTLSSASSLNGDFSGLLHIGYKIEKGKITGRLKNTVLTGNIFKVLKENLLEISSDTKFSWSSEYKLPWMLFKDIDVTS